MSDGRGSHTVVVLSETLRMQVVSIGDVSMSASDSLTPLASCLRRWACSVSLQFSEAPRFQLCHLGVVACIERLREIGFV